jgi:ABC-type transporter lipoprotein component MlaA
VNHFIQNVTRMQLLAIVAVAFAVGCARAPGVPSPEGNVRSPILPEASDLDDMADYDPWQPFNEVMFSFNHDVLDRFLVKPVATAWDTVIPRPARRAFARAIDNLDMPRRLVNNVLQFRPLGAGREVGRFLVNSTVGVAGLFDVASSIDLEKSDADTGQTLALYGLGPGPYLVLPTMAPSTVRDAIGTTADGMLDPLGFLPAVRRERGEVDRHCDQRAVAPAADVRERRGERARPLQRGTERLPAAPARGDRAGRRGSRSADAVGVRSARAGGGAGRGRRGR